MAELRPNKAKHKLQNGEVVSIISGINTPDVIDFLGQFDLDGIWIEGEHGPIDFADIPDLTRACDLWGMTSVVRVNQNNPGIIYRTLDVGAQGVVIPHVNTEEEGRQVVDATKFQPIGNRGMFGSRQAYGVPDYFAKANAETLVVILIEDIVAVNNIDEILRVDDIDVFFVAPSDLAQSMGLIGQVGHPDVQSTIDGALKKIIDSGKTAGTLANDSNVERYVGMGVKFIMTGWQPWVASGIEAYKARVASASS